jgi:hypothetical protein
VDNLRVYIAAVRALIPDDIETGGGSVAWEKVPRLKLEAGGTLDDDQPV